MTGSGLPPIEIKPSRLPLIYLGGVVSAVVVVTFGPALVQGEGIGTAELHAFLRGLGALALVGGGVTVVMLRSQRRMRARLLAEAPQGAVLATMAQPLQVEDAEGRRRSRTAGLTHGILVIGVEGVTYTEKGADPALAAVRLAWSEVEHVETRRENPFRLYLRVTTRARRIHGWIVPGAAAVEESLGRLRDGS